MLVKKLDKFLIVKYAKTTGSTASYIQGAVHPVTGKKPPTLEEYDPLNPGEWQIGVGGKMLPRLPEGTRVGKLVMGKYGLYAPNIRKHQIEFQKETDDGALPSEVATPFDKKMRNIGTVIALISLAFCLSQSRGNVFAQ